MKLDIFNRSVVISSRLWLSSAVVMVVVLMGFVMYDAARVHKVVALPFIFLAWVPYAAFIAFPFGWLVAAIVGIIGLIRTMCCSGIRVPEVSPTLTKLTSDRFLTLIVLLVHTVTYSVLFAYEFLREGILGYPPPFLVPLFTLFLIIDGVVFSSLRGSKIRIVIRWSWAIGVVLVLFVDFLLPYGHWDMMNLLIKTIAKVLADF
jgi:hypothetical protein